MERLPICSLADRSPSLASRLAYDLFPRVWTSVIPALNEKASIWSRILILRQIDLFASGMLAPSELAIGRRAGPK
jgi:hypothetical protein